MAETRIGIIGFGKIAQDQHVPAIAENPNFRLTAVLARHGPGAAGVPSFDDISEVLASGTMDAVAICTPPGPRHALARACLEAGLDVLLEKPPCATLGEIADLAALAQHKERSLLATWHSRFAPMVAKATAITAREGISTIDIRWLEDVEKWHPGQQWIWEQGGFGVFDPGINALSIATRLCPDRVLVDGAELTLQADGQQPETVLLRLTVGSGGNGTARFDWRHRGEEEWTIEIVTRAGTRLRLTDGGAALQVDDGLPERGAAHEYSGIYARFAELIAARESDVDIEPLRIVADALLMGRRDMRP